MSTVLPARATSYRLLAVAAFAVLTVVNFAGQRVITSPGQDDAPAKSREPAQTKRQGSAKRVAANRRGGYTNFSHRTAEHQLACDACHKFPSQNWKAARPGDQAFPDATDYPEHASCLTCHRQQFFARERPAPRICSVCHVQISPRFTERHPFPDLSERESDFRVGFPHEVHVDLVSEDLRRKELDRTVHLVAASFRFQEVAQAETSDPKSCAVCHHMLQPQGKSGDEFVTVPPKDIGDAFWLKKGTFKTTPANHATCFTCHSDEAGILPAPSNCNACHKLAATEPMAETESADFDPGLAAKMGINDPERLRKWRRRISSGAFRHEGGSHPTLSCTACHQLAAMNTLAPNTLRVAVKTCSVCHITATSDDGGILNFEVDQRKANPGFQCVKCHLVLGREPIPADHLLAIAAAPKS